VGNPTGELVLVGGSISDDGPTTAWVHESATREVMVQEVAATRQEAASTMFAGLSRELPEYAFTTCSMVYNTTRRMSNRYYKRVGCGNR
jgi:hypothetical protein